MTATTSRVLIIDDDERLNALRPLGLDHGINYTKDDVV